MRFFPILTLALLIMLAGTAQATNVAFPPDNCSAAAPFMAFNGVSTNENTYCTNGQMIMRNAMPQCGAGQTVYFDGSLFVCRDSSSQTQCAEGQMLAYIDGTWQCVNRGSTAIPTCTLGQYLTADGTQYLCKDVPDCPEGAVLGHANGQFMCVAAAGGSSIPDCPAGQVLTHRNGQYACVDASSSSSTQTAGSWCGIRYMACSNAWINKGQYIPGGDAPHIIYNDGGAGLGGREHDQFFIAGLPTKPCNGQAITSSCGVEGDTDTQHVFVGKINCPAGYVGTFVSLSFARPEDLDAYKRSVSGMTCVKLP